MPHYEVTYTDSKGDTHVTTVLALTRDAAADYVMDNYDADCIDDVRD